MINIIPAIHENVNKSINASKSVKEFFSEFFNSFSNNFIITDQYIVFDSLKPRIYEDIEQGYLTLQRFYKYSKESRNLANLIALFFYKYQTKTKITLTKLDCITTIINSYKEFARTISFPSDSGYTHLLTITYANNIEANNSIDEIFGILFRNDELRKRTNRGIHRLRNLITSQIRRELRKKGIKDKWQLNKLVKIIRNKEFKYFKVYELHKSNLLHVHILIKLPKFIRRRDFREIIELLARMFETSVIGIDLKRLKGNKDEAKRYVTKYLIKQYAENNMFYVEKLGEKIYFIRKDAFIRNDIPRITSKSRNVTTKRMKKDGFSINSTPVQKIAKEGKETIRIKREITRKDANKFKNILAQFKTRKQKEREREIEKDIKRVWATDILQDYIDGRYWSIKNVMKAINFARDDEWIQKKYYTLYQKALIKFNKDLEELEPIVNEYDDDWVEF